MELLKLKNKILELFDTDIDHLGDALMSVVTNNNVTKYDAFCELVDGDLTVDWLQMIYQYYHADRNEKMQDYTPKTLADLMARLTGPADIVVDMCAVQHKHGDGAGWDLLQDLQGTHQVHPCETNTKGRKLWGCI